MENSEVKNYITSHPNWSGGSIENRRPNWRYNEETCKYDNRPNAKDYFRKYMTRRIECPRCSKMVLRGDLSKHKKRPVCTNNKKDS